MTQSWTDLAAQLRTTDWDSTRAIADICDDIAAGALNADLHGELSNVTLTITRAGNPASHLEIIPTQRGPTQFRYVDTQMPERMWRRHEPPEKVLERFRKAMVQLAWIAEA
jgi:hypothetical protein